MDWILVKENKLYLNFDEQISPAGRKFRHSGVEKSELPSKWVDKTEKYHWIYSFRYLDNDEIFRFEVDYFDNVIKKL